MRVRNTRKPTKPVPQIQAASKAVVNAGVQLIDLIGKALDASPTGRVVIDLQHVKQFTSGPLDALVISARDADERGGCLLVTGAVSGFVGKVVSTAVTPKIALSYPTVRAALAAVSKEAVIYYDEKLIRVK